ncbi:hypothetical protein C0581_01840 [Candidatus Parcubacteria bacterium]|nr:MAG: hypothetical protein C0581_01840 [Candidatus Parcubacteria bacterium]
MTQPRRIRGMEMTLVIDGREEEFPCETSQGLALIARQMLEIGNRPAFRKLLGLARRIKKGTLRSHELVGQLSLPRRH